MIERDQNQGSVVVRDLPGEWRPVVQECPIDGGPLTKFMFVPEEHPATDQFLRWQNPDPPPHLRGRTVSDYFVSRRQQIRWGIVKALNPAADPGNLIDRPARLPDVPDGNKTGVYISPFAALHLGQWLWSLGPRKGEEPPESVLRAMGERHVTEELLRLHFERATTSDSTRELGEGTRRSTVQSLTDQKKAPAVTLWTEPGWPVAPVPEWRRTLTLVYSVIDGIGMR